MQNDADPPQPVTAAPSEPVEAPPEPLPEASFAPLPADPSAELLPPSPLPDAPLPGPQPPAPRSRTSTLFLIALSATALVADFATKAWARGALQGLDPKTHSLKKLEIVKGHLEFIFAQNPGGAWSFLRGLPDSLRRPFFLVVSAAAIVFIVTIYQRVRSDQTTMRWGLPLALGGAVGNLVDRVRYGWVVDFIDVSLRWGGREHHWPTFNVADIAIVIGVGLMAIDMLRPRAHARDDGTVPGLPVHMAGDPLQGPPASR